LLPLLLGSCGGSDGEASCTPECSGLQCGDDGCGGSCGSCSGDLSCNEDLGICTGGEGNTLTGSLFFQARFPEMDDEGTITLSSIIEFPAAGMLALAVDAGGNTLGAGQVDDEGAFSVDLSRAPMPSDELYFACVWAPSLGSDEAKLVVGVAENGGEPSMGEISPWAFTKALSADPSVGKIMIKENQGSGAIYTFLLSQLAMRTVWQEVLGGDEDAVDPLALLWAPGVSWSCGACYGSTYAQTMGDTELPHTIFMGGEADSSSAWGYTVVLHEFGHYVADRYLRDDSPGGSHTIGSAIVPPFAFSEGLATFFALSTFSRWVDGPQPLYWDIQGGSSFWVDYSSLSFSSGTEQYYMSLPSMEGGLKQSLDENYAGAVLWHLWDGQDIPDQDDPEDGTALGTAKTFAALASSRFLNLDRAYAGADLVDFLDAVACNNTGLAEAMYETVINLLGFPFDGPVLCD
jgi:hypothetical protein